LNRIVIAAATGLLAITAVVGVAGSANADTPTPTAPKHSLAEVQAASAALTTKLSAHIAALEVRVGANKILTSDQKATITAALKADDQGVKTGAAKVAADTTVEQARKDSRETISAGRAAERKEAKQLRADARADHQADKAAKAAKAPKK